MRIRERLLATSCPAVRYRDDLALPGSPNLFKFNAITTKRRARTSRENNLADHKYVICNRSPIRICCESVIDRKSFNFAGGLTFLSRSHMVLRLRSRSIHPLALLSRRSFFLRPFAELSPPSPFGLLLLLLALFHPPFHLSNLRHCFFTSCTSPSPFILQFSVHSKVHFPAALEFHDFPLPPSLPPSLSLSVCSIACTL